MPLVISVIEIAQVQQFYKLLVSYIGFLYSQILSRNLMQCVLIYESCHAFQFNLAYQLGCSAFLNVLRVMRFPQKEGGNAAIISKSIWFLLRGLSGAE
jgi:hypothetical protein